MFWMKVRVAAAVLGGAMLAGGGGALAAAESAQPAASPAPAPAQPGEWSWTKLIEPKDLPDMGNESAATFDTSIGRMVLFGGHVGLGGPERSYIYLYDPKADKWENPRPANRPEGGCCIRDGVYDQANRRSYFFGSHRFQHGWQWQPRHQRTGGMPWSYEHSTGTWTCTKPMPSSGGIFTGAVYDSDNQVVVAYGGEFDSSQKIKVYDGYANAWTLLTPKGKGPAWLTLPPMCYDPERKATLLFEIGKSDNFWSYDLPTNAWTLIKESCQAHPKGWPIMVYDPRNKMPVLFVPTNEAPLKVFAFDWGKSDWFELAVKGEPPPSHGCMVGAYDPFGHQTILGKGIAMTNFAGMRRPATPYVLHHPEPKSAAAAGLPAPQKVQLVTGADRAEIAFEPVAGAEHYVLYKGSGARIWEAKFQKTGEGKEPKFADAGLTAGTTYFYFVRAADGKGQEGAPSLKVRTAPRAPAAPVVSVLSKEEVEVSWATSTEPDVAGYNLYRGPKTFPIMAAAAPALTKLNKDPLKETACKDKVALAGTGDASILYVLRAVNRLGVESGPSPWATTIPSEPISVKAREENGQPVISWKPNPEKSLKGYSIYRMDTGTGDPTKQAAKIAGPVKEATFTDASAKPNPNPKYYVVAVDALDQEGYSSVGVMVRDVIGGE